MISTLGNRQKRPLQLIKLLSLPFLVRNYKAYFFEHQLHSDREEDIEAFLKEVMPREIVTIQVGQCGNQLGMRWWDVMLQEHNTYPQYIDAKESVFATSPSTSQSSSKKTTLKDKRNNSNNSEGLKARCVAVDMEEGVLKSMLRGPLRSLFDSHFFISDVSGAGNNWAVGHMEYGDQYIESIIDAVRAQVEQCECVQAFLLLHSLSGGTGSGLGTRILAELDDEYPHLLRLCTVVMPSHIDDVVTGPYNCCFALRELIDHADCVLPLDNDALAKMSDAAQLHSHSNMRGWGVASDKSNEATSSHNDNKNSNGFFSAAQPTKTKGLPYDTMNGLVAQMLSNLTCAMRFPGPLNMDINEITTNLVPYPQLHFLTASMSPLQSSVHSTSTSGPRAVESMLSSCFLPSHQFVNLNDVPLTSITSTNISSRYTQPPEYVSSSSYVTTTNTNTTTSTNASRLSPEKSSMHQAQTKMLAAGLIARGPQITIGDLTRSIPMLRRQCALPYWNEDGFKTALCGVSPLGQRNAVLMLANHTGIHIKLQSITNKFAKLYSVRSHVHHYERYLSLEFFDTTLETLRSIIDDYQYLSSAVPEASGLPRSMKDLVYY